MDEQPNEVYQQPAVVKKPSRIWYLVPIFFGILGGLIAYFIVKDEDKEMAKRMLIVGLVISLIPGVIVLFGVIAYFGIFAPSAFIAPTTNGFTSVYVLAPWSLSASDGRIMLNIQDKAGQQVSVSHLTVDIGKGPVECSVSPAVTIDTSGSKVVSCTPISGWTNQKSNDPYVATVTIGYTVGGSALTETGSISGTYA